MRENINRILTILMGSFTGVFIGRALWLYADVRRHPALYETQSAPWYCALIAPALLLLTALLALGAVKFLLRRGAKR